MPNPLSREQVEEKLGDIASLSKFPPCKSLLDHDAALRAKVEALEQAVAQLNNVLRQSGWGQGEIDSAAYTFDELAKATAALVAERDRLREALEQLEAYQNGCPLPSYEKGWAHAMALTARALRGEGALDDGGLWSFMRSTLSQGGSIQQDYQAGKYKSYEHYSARLDVAARERAEALLAAVRGEGGRGTGCRT